MWCWLICVCKWNAVSVKIIPRGSMWKRPPKLFDTKWWTRYGSKPAQVFFSAMVFIFSERTKKRLPAPLSQLNSQNEWKMTQAVEKTLFMEPTTIRSRRVWRFIVTEAKSLQGIILIRYRTLKVPSVTNNMINSIHCLQTFSFDLFLRVSLYDVATQPLFWKFESLNSSVCWNMLISAGVASYPNLSEPEKHTERDELFPSVCC